MAVIGVGTDVCSIERMRTALARTPGLKQRVFTDDEQTYCDRRRDPAERYAARFAAKEAVMKAMGVGLGACKTRDIEIVRADSSAPSIVLHATAADLAASRGISAWHLAISHDGGVALAVAVAE
jgi:holo-[acyl-carrier protein] synthase